jgi:hypothetical protein
MEGYKIRKLRPDGKVIFGGAKNFEQRLNNNIDKAKWRQLRLHPLTSYGDKQYAGNRHFRLSEDGRTCTFTMLQGGRQKGMVWRNVTLHLSQLRGNQNKVLKQAIKLAAEKQINLTFRINDTHLYVIVDPVDLPDHPQRRKPIQSIHGRAVGVDLNPRWIGATCVENRNDVLELKDTQVLDSKLIALNHQVDASHEVVQEVLAGACNEIIALARQYGAGVITVEQGLGKLRSGGKSKKRNQLLNFWSRTALIAILRKNCNLAGIKLVLVWSGYSTTSGNLWFNLPDACASAAEIARRGLAAGSKKELLPVWDEGWTRRWKDVLAPAEVPLLKISGWIELHRGIKAAKTIGYRRPHPPLAGPGVQEGVGLVVRRLCRRRRSGLVARNVRSSCAQAISPETCGLKSKAVKPQAQISTR